MINLVWLIPLLPGLAFAIIGLFTRRSRSVSTFLSLGAMGVATALAYGTFFELLGGARMVDVRLPWINLGDRSLTVGWQVDPLTAIMLVVVTSETSVEPAVPGVVVIVTCLPTCTSDGTTALGASS